QSALHPRVRQPLPEFLPRECLRDARRSRAAQRQAHQPESIQLRALQGLRHSGPLSDHYLGPPRRWWRAQLRRHVAHLECARLLFLQDAPQLHAVGHRSAFEQAAGPCSHLTAKRPRNRFKPQNSVNIRLYFWFCIYSKRYVIPSAATDLQFICVSTADPSLAVAVQARLQPSLGMTGCWAMLRFSTSVPNELRSLLIKSRCMLLFSAHTPHVRFH